ncbi:Mrl1 protein [Saccharomycopsis crataegensis]|uniref:Mrl1 protein n=1 Tax=Saccharomycopsis crataegensis TaxID=43959 RepID=A0AAV5QG32_9ASCO|nr:Mrl1 protein [Saccharomycopsis crataegensis]
MANILLLLVLSLFSWVVAAGPVNSSPDNSNSNNDQQALPECTVVNAANKAFYDLSSLSRPNVEKGLSKPPAFSARGFDYLYNFTLGVCATPLSGSSIKNSHDIDSSIKNASLIGGYYTGLDGIKYSIGNFNQTPIFRGRKLVLTYTNGSYCRDPHTNGYLKDANGKNLRKSTILSFTCDKEMVSKAQASFVGALNGCDYFFEVRTPHACITPKKADDLAAIWIFLFILFAALSVYFSGGFLYKTLFRRNNNGGWIHLSNNVRSGLKNNSFKNSFVTNHRGEGLMDESGRYQDDTNEDNDDTNKLLDHLDSNLENVSNGNRNENWDWNGA